MKDTIIFISSLSELQYLCPKSMYNHSPEFLQLAQKAIILQTCGVLALSNYGCFYGLGALFAGVFVMRALLVGVLSGPVIFGNPNMGYVPGFYMGTRIHVLLAYQVAHYAGLLASQRPMSCDAASLQHAPLSSVKP